MLRYLQVAIWLLNRNILIAVFHVQERMRKERKSYMEFYKDYSFFLKEGIVTSTDQYEKEEIARLLQFECSSLPAGETVQFLIRSKFWNVSEAFGIYLNLFQVSIPEYCDKMKAGQREIFYLSAPSRQLAENSPYYENLKKADTEVPSSVCRVCNADRCSNLFDAHCENSPRSTKIGAVLLRAL